MFRRTLVAILLAVASVSWLPAQTINNSVVFRSESTLVTVDVVASEKDGAPAVIEPSQWRVFENGREQRIVSVEYQSAALTRAPKLLGTGWSNNMVQQQRSAASIGTTVLLIDLLNTSPDEQMLARDYALSALRGLPGHERFVLFLMSEDLKQISGYNDDLAAVQEFVKKQPIQNLLTLNKDPTVHGAFADPVTGADLFRENITNFEKQVVSTSANQRVRRTLDSLSRISEIVERQPGRKSLIWITSSFPLSIALTPADNKPSVTPTRTSEFYGMEDFSSEVTAVSKQLSKARVAVYPIVVNSLTSSLSAASNAAAPVTASDSESDVSTNRDASIASARLTANLTGGRATVNSNDIVGAFRRAVVDANDYYTISFAPTDTGFHGEFRNVEVRTSSSGVELHYRPGYYATESAANEPKQRFEQALSLDTPPNTGIETVARLKEAKPPILELRIATNQLSFERMPDGRRKVSLLVGYLVAPKNGTTPWRGMSPAERGLPMIVMPNLPSGTYLLRAGVVDLNSRRIGTVDVDTSPEATRVAASAAVRAPATIQGQTLYPELGKLTPGIYSNLFFNFTLPLPVTNSVSRLRLPQPPPGTHVLLALSIKGVSPDTREENGTLLVFAEEPSVVKSTDPRQAAAEESARAKVGTVWGPRGAGLGICTADDGCTAIVFFERRGYLLKFVGKSDGNNQLLRRIWQSLRSVHFSDAVPRHLPASHELYSGPAIPAYVMDKAMASPVRFASGALDGHLYTNPALGLRYGYPADWNAMTAQQDGLARFTRYRAVPVGEVTIEREHRFFQSCSQPLLHLTQSRTETSEGEANDLSLFAISISCLGIQSPVLKGRPKDSLAELAAALSMLHDFGDVTSAQTEVISGRAFLTLTGQTSYPLHGSALMKRRYQHIFVTLTGDTLLAWFLTSEHPPSNAFPATKLELGDVVEGNMP